METSTLVLLLTRVIAVPVGMLGGCMARKQTGLRHENEILVCEAEHHRIGGRTAKHGVNRSARL